MSLSRLTLYALLTAWASLLHQLSYPSWVKTLEPDGWGLFICSILLMLRPSSIRLFVSLLLLRVIYSLHWVPMLRGHLFLEGLFTLGMLLALGCAWWRDRTPCFDPFEGRERLFDSFAPVLRLTGLLVYITVALAKLNHPFFQVETSAAAEFVLWAHKFHPWVPTHPWVLEASIWATLLFEGGIPVLLVFKRTRWLGLLAALFFHTLLGLHPIRIASFSMTMVLLLYPWLPRNATTVIQQRYEKLASRLRLTPRHCGWAFHLAIAAFALLYLLISQRSLRASSLYLGLSLWWWQSAAMFCCLWVVRQVAAEPTRELLRMPFKPLWIFIFLLALNCVSPYIGLKTRSALTMHASLRTEKGYWNHLILPEAMRVFGYQDDLVEILDSDLRDFAHLSEHNMRLPYFEFRRWCRLAKPDFYVVFRRNGEAERRFEKQDGRGSDPELMQAHPVLERLLCFNPVGSKHDYIPALTKRIGPPRNIVPTDLRDLE